MTVKASVRKVDRLNRKFRALPREVQAPTRQAVRLGGLAIENTAKGKIRQPGGGRTYTTRFFTDAQGRVRPIGTRPPHRASAPGQPPASDTGRLLGSVESLIVDDGLAAEIGTGLNYGRFLEFGTSKMAARPWLHPSFRENVEAVSRAIRTAMKTALRRAGAA